MAQPRASRMRILSCRRAAFEMSSKDARLTNPASSSAHVMFTSCSPQDRQRGSLFSIAILMLGSFEICRNGSFIPERGTPVTVAERKRSPGKSRRWRGLSRFPSLRTSLAYFRDLPHQVFRLRRCAKQVHSPPVPNAYASSVTTGVTSKFSVGGGEAVVHSSPLAPHGLGPTTGPYRADQIK